MNNKIVTMKWKLFCAVMINLVVIRGIACAWPFPPHPPVPLELWEDHYLRISHGPYAPGLSHVASSHEEAFSEPETINHHILYPMDHLQHLVSAEPEGRLHEMDLEDKREFVGYSQREPVLKLRHGNYRYRKRIKVPRPFNQKTVHHNQQVKHKTSFGHPPRRYNIPEIHDEHESKLNFPNSVNDKLSQEKKVIVLEEESNRQNQNSSKTNSNSSNNSNGNNAKKSSKDDQVVGSQTSNKDNNNGVQPVTRNVDIPIEITSYAMQTPDGAVTQVTEMLYDVANNPFKIPTSTPVISPFLPPSTVITATDDPRVTQTPYLESGYSELEGGSVPRPPLSSGAKSDGITISPIITWTSRRSTVSPVTTWPSQRSLPAPTPPRLILSTAPSETGTKRYRKRFSTPKPSSTTHRNSARESPSGLSGAAIAGIVIGSMVSVMLLAGTSLFVMYKNPFRRVTNTQRNGAFVENSLPNVIQTNDPNTVPRVHRWPPRRQRRSNT